MTDTARGQVSMTLVVTIAADADSGEVDVIHHDIGCSLGGKLEYEMETDDKWFYDAIKNVTTYDALIAGDFTDTGTVADADLVKFVSVTHLSKDSDGNATAIAIHLTLDGGNPKTAADAIKLDAGESIVLKLYGCRVDNLVACSADDSSVTVKVAALIDDVA